MTAALRRFKGAIALAVSLFATSVGTARASELPTDVKPDIFCPANIQEVVALHYGGSTAFQYADDAFGVVLSASQPKTISGSIVALTSTAFYRVGFDRQILQPVTRKISLNGAAVHEETDYESKPIYFRLPQREAIQAVWIGDIFVNGQPAECATLPHSGYGVYSDPRYSVSGGLSPQDIASAAPAKPPPAVFLRKLDMSGCDKILKEAHMTQGVSPAYPRGLAIKQHSVIVKIALNAAGGVADAAILQSSGNDWIDAEAMNAAIHSRYAAKEFLCTPVPGYYSFRANFL